MVMQDKECIIVGKCRLKIQSLWLPVRHHSASHVILNSCPCDRIFHLHRTTITDSYILEKVLKSQTVKFYFFPCASNKKFVKIFSVDTKMPQVFYEKFGQKKCAIARK